MSSIYPRLLNNVIGTQFQVVSGYAGMASVQLAMERGEVDGISGDSWYNGNGSGISLDWFRNGTVRNIALVGSKRPPELADVPLLTDLSQDADSQQLLELFSSPPQVGKPAVMGPDVPGERVAAMRQAFNATMSDPEFLADAAKLSLPVDPISGEELAALTKRLVAVPDALVQRARAAIRR
jgi:tripartite-type tricarboxylate transporter receptor subunit TctC